MPKTLVEVGQEKEVKGELPPLPSFNNGTPVLFPTSKWLYRGVIPSYTKLYRGGPREPPKLPTWSEEAETGEEGMASSAKGSTVLEAKSLSRLLWH